MAAIGSNQCRHGVVGRARSQLCVCVQRTMHDMAACWIGWLARSRVSGMWLCMVSGVWHYNAVHQDAWSLIMGGTGGSSGGFRPHSVSQAANARSSNSASYSGAQRLPARQTLRGKMAATISQMPETLRPRHAAVVRVTHWLITLAFLALLVTGVEILTSHPRFYWGEIGNVNTHPLFTLPIPSSRDTVPTGYGYVLPDQNGWSRYLHFEAAWVAVLTGLLYVAFGLSKGHFRRNLLPSSSNLSPASLARDVSRHLRLQRPSDEEAWSYNVLQRLTYLLVIFVLFPLVIWTGLAMSPTVEGAFPVLVAVLGGRQSARTIHFFVSILLVLFLLVHVVMVYLAGFWNRVGAMIVGRLPKPMERV
jgi:thiosulfate reductase cytochrome b subunit